MKLRIQIIMLIASVAVVASSCKDDFLSKKNTVTLEAAIYVSPERGTETHPVEWSNAGNANYIISDIPEWLKADQRTGQFVDGIATSARYVFANRNGTGVYVVKNVINHNAWSVEYIPVN